MLYENAVAFYENLISGLVDRTVNIHEVEAVSGFKECDYIKDIYRIEASNGFSEAFIKRDNSGFSVTAIAVVDGLISLFTPPENPFSKEGVKIHSLSIKDVCSFAYSSEGGPYWEFVNNYGVSTYVTLHEETLNVFNPNAEQKGSLTALSPCRIHSLLTNEFRKAKQLPTIEERLFKKTNQEHNLTVAERMLEDLRDSNDRLANEFIQP